MPTTSCLQVHYTVPIWNYQEFKKMKKTK